jgi:hypothetical protein
MEFGSANEIEDIQIQQDFGVQFTCDASEISNEESESMYFQEIQSDIWEIDNEILESN